MQRVAAGGGCTIDLETSNTVMSFDRTEIYFNFPFKLIVSQENIFKKQSYLSAHDNKLSSIWSRMYNVANYEGSYVHVRLVEARGIVWYGRMATGGEMLAGHLRVDTAASHNRHWHWASHMLAM